MNCISCKKEHNENFCPNCGEKNGVKRINLSSMLAGVFYSITTMDKGFFYNFKTLLINPKTIVEEYIMGKRKGILNPLSYLLLSTTVYLLVVKTLQLPVEIKSVIPEPEFQLKPDAPISKAAYNMGYSIYKYVKYFWVLFILPMGLIFKLFFNKYNYLEHVAISSFILGQATIFSIISYIAFRFILVIDPVVYFVIFWSIVRIYFDKRFVFESIVKLICSFFFYIIFLLLIFFSVVLTIAYYFY